MDFTDTYSKTCRLYCPEAPEFISLFAQTPEMLRLTDVGMNCGCEYTSFPLFRDIGRYTRFDHSLGTALIVWNFTRDTRQTLSALFHDISTPVFAHVIDFLNGDYMQQESTEAETSRIISESCRISTLLQQYGILPEEVSDYHVYPLADSPSPRLCADRLEYTIGNMINYGFRSFDEAARYYGDLCAGLNEFGEPELIFRHEDVAVEFAGTALKCSKVYVSDPDRYSMQMLSELIRSAAESGVVSPRDLYGTESLFIEKLCSDKELGKRWNAFRGMSEIQVGDGEYSRVIFAKKRCIDPYVEGKGRVSRLSDGFSSSLCDYLNHVLNYPVYSPDLALQ